MPTPIEIPKANLAHVIWEAVGTLADVTPVEPVVPVVTFPPPLPARLAGAVQATLSLPYSAEAMTGHWAISSASIITPLLAMTCGGFRR